MEISINTGITMTQEGRRNISIDACKIYINFIYKVFRKKASEALVVAS